MTTVSVIIAAHSARRWQQLQATVRAFAQQSVTPDEIVVVVDHNTELLSRAERELVPHTGNLRIMANRRRPGLSGSRNSALETVVADIVVFLDDDAVPVQDWLERIVAPYQDPAVIAVGGVAVPVWPKGCDRPLTLPREVGGEWGELDWAVGCTFRGAPSVAADVRNLIGSNMSFRRGVFLTVGGFSEELGRTPGALRSGEQTELCIRAHIAFPNATILFVPAARVLHGVSRDRLTWRYLMRRCFAEGKSKAMVRQLVGPHDVLRDEWRYALTKVPKAMARELRLAIGRPVGRRVHHLAGVFALVIAFMCSAMGYVFGRSRAVKSDLAGHPIVLSMSSQLRLVDLNRRSSTRALRC